jgi:hypothetical protein
VDGLKSPLLVGFGGHDSILPLWQSCTCNPRAPPISGRRWRGGGADSGWPGARAHVAGNDPWELIGIAEWRQPGTRTEWADALNRPLPEPALRRLRPTTRSGAPYGSEEFVRALEEKTGRCLELRGRGRPRRRDMAVSA